MLLLKLKTSLSDERLDGSGLCALDRTSRAGVRRRVMSVRHTHPPGRKAVIPVV